MKDCLGISLALLFSIYAWAGDFLTELAERQDRLFNIFLPSTGYNSWEEYEDALAQREKLSLLREAISSEEIELTIHAPEQARKKILKRGILNQYQTGTSRGVYDINGRLTVESKFLNMTIDEYKKIPEYIRPKYGRVLSKKIFNCALPPSIYGEDVYLLRLENVAKRLTWTPGDSFNRYKKKTSQHSEYFYQWDGIFLPWSKRNLIIPYIEEDLFFEATYILPRGAFIYPKANLSMPPIVGGGSKEQYVEFQAWGEISVSDIKALIFRNSLPDPAMLETLAAHKIDTYNGKLRPPRSHRATFYKLSAEERCQEVEFDLNTIRVIDADVNVSLCGEIDWKDCYCTCF